MSLPFYSFNCTSCGLVRRFYFDTAYEFVDSNGDGYAPSLQTAWCDDCDCVVTSANPQTLASIASEMGVRSEWIAEEQNRKPSLLHPFRKPDESLIRKWEAEIVHFKMSTEFFRYQSMVPRCLTCGGEHVIPIELPDKGRSSIGVVHHCGGEVHASCEGRISFGELPVVKYNIKGQILSDEREDNAAKDLSQESLRAIVGLAGNVSLQLLESAQLPEQIETVVHPEFSVLGVYLSVREFLAVSEHGENPVAVSALILTSPPYLNLTAENSEEVSDNLKHFVLDALRKYDREANCAFGDGPSRWSTSKESQEFGRQVFQILYERLSAYPQLDSNPFSRSISGLENEIAKQSEILSAAFNELLKVEAI